MPNQHKRKGSIYKPNGMIASTFHLFGFYINIYNDEKNKNRNTGSEVCSER